MIKFIEITDLDGNLVSINVNHIFEVEKGTHKRDVPGSTIKMSINGYNGFPFQYVETSLSYDYVMNLIKS